MQLLNEFYVYYFHYDARSSQHLHTPNTARLNPQQASFNLTVILWNVTGLRFILTLIIIFMIFVDIALVSLRMQKQQRIRALPFDEYVPQDIHFLTFCISE